MAPSSAEGSRSKRLGLHPRDAPRSSHRSTTAPQPPLPPTPRTAAALQRCSALSPTRAVVARSPGRCAAAAPALPAAPQQLVRPAGRVATRRASAPGPIRRLLACAPLARLPCVCTSLHEHLSRLQLSCLARTRPSVAAVPLHLHRSAAEWPEERPQGAANAPARPPVCGRTHDGRATRDTFCAAIRCRPLQLLRLRGMLLLCCCWCCFCCTAQLQYGCADDNIDLPRLRCRAARAGTSRVLSALQSSWAPRGPESTPSIAPARVLTFTPALGRKRSRFLPRCSPSQPNFSFSRARCPHSAL